MGPCPVFPLSKGGVEGVAAALKAAELVSGDQYLNELKLMHVESGHQMEPWLLRVLALCKSLSYRGPIKRAPEVALELIPAAAWGPHRECKVALAALAFACGVAWMLRKIELSRVKWEHVTWDVLKRTVRLYIPQLKADQQGAWRGKDAAMPRWPHAGRVVHGPCWRS